MERDERLLSSFEMCARPNELQVIGFFSSPWISAEKFPIRRLMPVLSVEEFSEKNEGRKRDEHRWVRFTSSVVFPFFFFFEIGKKKKYGRKAREYRHGGDEGEKKEGGRKGEM